MSCSARKNGFKEEVMPRDHINDFKDSLLYAAKQQEEMVEILRDPLRVIGVADGVLSNRWDVTPENTFRLTTEYDPEQFSKLFATTTGVDAYYTNFCKEEEKTCEVCGEPVDDELGGHLCRKCYIAAKKYRNALTDREVAFGG